MNNEGDVAEHGGGAVVVAAEPNNLASRQQLFILLAEVDDADSVKHWLEGNFN